MTALHLLLISTLALSLTACKEGGGDDKDDTGEDTPADTDGDGMSDEDEAAAGTDPTLADTDGDGLNDPDDIAFGTDPLNPDTDGDGLNDAEEMAAGTSGVLADTDGDTYNDFDEITEGKDPLDAESRIYIGYWPYNRNKEDIVDPGWTGTASTGDTLPRFQWVDQHGDIVDNYDFAMQGKPIIVDLSAMWCGYCHDLAQWLDGEDPDYLNMTRYDSLRDDLVAGRFYWLTLIDQNANGGAASSQVVLAWYRQHPNEKVPVLADEHMQAQRWMDIYGYPTLMLLDENMTITFYNSNNYMAALTQLMNLLAE